MSDQIMLLSQLCPSGALPKWSFGILSGTFYAPLSFQIIETGCLLITGIVFHHAWTSKGDDGTPPKPFNRSVLAMIAIALFTFIAEHSLSESTTSIYCYPHNWMFMVSGVPVWIPLGWAWVVYIAMHGTEKLGLNFVRAPIVIAFLAMAVDFQLDPIAELQGWWQWEDDPNRTQFFDIPLSNFMAWFVIVWSFTFSMMVLDRKLPQRIHNRIRDVLITFGSIVPALVCVAIFKALSEAGFNKRESIMDGGLPWNFPWYTNEILVSGIIWGSAILLVAPALYHAKRDRQIDKVVVFVPLLFFAAMLSFLAIMVITRFTSEGVPGYDDFASLAIFMPAMAAVGLTMFSWPYLDNIFPKRLTLLSLPYRDIIFPTTGPKADPDPD